MKLELMNTIVQFEQLQIGDLILVKWKNSWVKQTPKAKSIMFYNIYDNRLETKEIICQKKDYHFFSYEMYLKGESGAKEVYKVIES